MSDKSTSLPTAPIVAVKTCLASDASEFDFTPAPLDIPSKTFLKPLYFVLPDGSIFHDRKIPSSIDHFGNFQENLAFPKDYFVNLHKCVKSYDNYNYAGARLKLEHCKINVNKFRVLLPSDFDDLGLLQYLEYGFPLGLNDDYMLQPVLKNHSSSYDYFTHIDKFVQTELDQGGLSGPFSNSPFQPIMTSPLMTSVKKPNSRRAVFDASFGDFSLNLNTPEKIYLCDQYEFSFPKLDDFSKIILSLGKGCFMWKRDLSRFFLQLPLNPLDYDKVACVWRGQLLFFTSYVWGCRHAGFNGQRVTSAVSAIHRSLRHTHPGSNGVSCHQLCPTANCDREQLKPFNTLNYSDDFAGVEPCLETATVSFNLMSSLLSDLGLTESLNKAEKPCQVLTYLGIEFDSNKLEMRVNPRKCAELRTDLEMWHRKTVASKSEIQSILGKLMWVARAVKFSRCFVLRVIAESKKLSSQKQKTTLSNAIRKDLL